MNLGICLEGKVASTNRVTGSRCRRGKSMDHCQQSLPYIPVRIRTSTWCQLPAPSAFVRFIWQETRQRGTRFLRQKTSCPQPIEFMRGLDGEVVHAYICIQEATDSH